MFDNICTLPQTSDIFAQAIHPNSPILSVGLSSGHVQTYKIPTEAVESTSTQNNHTTLINKRSALKQSNLNGSSRPGIGNRRSSQDGFGTVENAWRTRRHKGSCRSLAFSKDGDTLFSAGTDGLVKAASCETGRVTGKIALPATSKKNQDPDAPSLIHVLSPQNLLIGTDTGKLHVYDLRQPSSTLSQSPSKTLKPHITSEQPDYSEPITSLTSLPPTAASTSGTSKSWITTSGSTLACSDLRKGIVAVSEDQGDELLSSICIDTSTHDPDKSRKTNNNKNNTLPPSSPQRMLTGTTSGTVTLWDRNDWIDQKARIKVYNDQGGMFEDGSVDTLALVPEYVKLPGEQVAGHNTFVAGLGNGVIRCMKVVGKSGSRFVGEVTHDERNVEGVDCLGFDVTGKMISAGGSFVKVWGEKVGGDEGEEEEDEDDDNDVNDKDNLSEDDPSDINDNNEDNSEDSQAEEEESESESEREEEKQKKKEQQETKKRKRKTSTKDNLRGSHGILKFSGLD